MTNTRPTVLIIDDTPMNISVLVELLKAEYRTVVAKTGEQALLTSIWWGYP